MNEKSKNNFVDKLNLRQNTIYDVSNGIFVILRDLSVQLFSKFDSYNDPKCSNNSQAMPCQKNIDESKWRLKKNLSKQSLHDNNAQLLLY